MLLLLLLVDLVRLSLLLLLLLQPEALLHNLLGNALQLTQAGSGGARLLAGGDGRGERLLRAVGAAGRVRVGAGGGQLVELVRL